MGDPGRQWGQHRDARRLTLWPRTGYGHPERLSDGKQAPQSEEWLRTHEQPGRGAPVALTRWHSLPGSSAPTCCGNGAVPRCPRAEQERVRQGQQQQATTYSTAATPPRSPAPTLFLSPSPSDYLGPKPLLPFTFSQGLGCPPAIPLRPPTHTPHACTHTHRRVRGHGLLQPLCRRLLGPRRSLTLMVTFPLVIFRMLNPTVGIMSSLNCPDWRESQNQKRANPTDGKAAGCQRPSHHSSRPQGGGMGRPRGGVSASPGDHL